MSTIIFDTHAFVKAYVNAKNEEERAEILAKNLSEARQENVIIASNTHKIVDEKFDKTKNDLATKEFVRQETLATKEFVRQEINSVKEFVKAAIAESKNDTTKWMFGMFLAFSSAQLGLIMLILKFFFKGAGGV